jgi:hypothetical protein
MSEISQTVLFYLITFAFTAASVLYTEKQFDDEKAGWAHARSRWHGYGAFQRSTPFLIALMIGKQEWYDVLLAAAICIPGFEIGVNKVALHVSTFYNGTTSTLDKNFGKYKWYCMGALLFISLIIKFTSIKYPISDFFVWLGHLIYSN